MTRDHQEVDLGLLAGVTDRGLRHHRNEDAMELAVATAGPDPVLLAVVCDGVSTSNRPDEASLAAAKAAARVLTAAAEAGTDLAAASAEAVRAAGEAVASLAEFPGGVPSATYVSAAVTSAEVTLCWLGDSRAYWLADSPDSAAQRLTTDDSLAQEMVTAGLLEETEALDSPHAHLATFRPPSPGVLLLCSDGLWNYQPDAARLAEMTLPTAQTDPLSAAKTLVKFALEQGGRDNITVVLIPFPAKRPVPPD
jgi:serine/threonine protein phosphatase PrpC